MEAVDSVLISVVLALDGIGKDSVRKDGNAKSRNVDSNTKNGNARSRNVEKIGKTGNGNEGENTGNRN